MASMMPLNATLFRAMAFPAALAVALCLTVPLPTAGSFGGAFLTAKYGMDVVRVQLRRPEPPGKTGKLSLIPRPQVAMGLTPPHTATPLASAARQGVAG